MARILIVEDEARISAFVAKGLDADGTPRPSSRRGERLDLALSGDFDLAVLDINLPGLDGFTVLEQLARPAARCRSSCSPRGTR